MRSSDIINAKVLLSHFNEQEVGCLGFKVAFLLLNFTNMAKDKKSFILYVDQKDLWNKLPDEIAGKLIKHIYSYVSDENPSSNDLMIEIAFEPIKQQLKRDLKLFEEKRVKRKEAGIAGANKRWQSIANDSNRINDIAKIADNVNVNVNDNIYRAFAHLSITNSDVEKLLEKYSIEEIDEILDSIENFKGNKKYSSLYLTATKWLAKNKPKQIEMIYDPLVEKARQHGFIK